MEHESLPPGTQIGPWTLVRPLGRGANAIVYAARRGDRDVALKLRKRGEPELDRRFLREFEALRGLAIPGIVRVYDAGLTDGWTWYAMEIVDGQPLRSWIEAGGEVPTRVERILRVGPLLFDALAAVHRAGMVHRDLKPGNVLVDGAGRPHVLDFGVVRWGRSGEPLTNEGGLVGTLPFMAPEQISGQALTARADIFSVGLMLLEGITGKRNRPARPQEWLRIQCLERPPVLAARYVEVPRALSTLIERMVALDPDDRPAADEAASLLRAVSQGRAPASWPAPAAWVGPPPEWQPAPRGAIFLPLLRVLSGPTGSGKRRAAEQVRRRATLAGARTVRGRCRIERPGGALEQIFESLLGAPAEDAWRRTVSGNDGNTLLEMWPHLPFATDTAPREVGSAGDVVRACARALARAVDGGELLVVLEDLDEVDALTARVIETLCHATVVGLTLIATYDDRDAVRRAKRLVDLLVADRRATMAPLPDLTHEEALSVARELVPEHLEVEAEGGSPLRAAEAGWEALARARGERFPMLPMGASSVALVDLAVHKATWDVLGVDPNVLMARGALTAAGSQRWTVRDPLVRTLAMARMPSRVHAANKLLEALAADPEPARTAAARARLLLLTGESASVFAPAVEAALEAEATGRYREASSWLHLVDTLPRDRESADYKRLRFELARCRAAVAAETGSERARPDLIALAAGRVQNETEGDEVELLEAGLRRRENDARGALVQLLRLASKRTGGDDAARGRAVRALLEAAAIRLELGQLDEATLHLERVRELRGPDARADRASVSLDILQAEVAMARGQVEEAVRACHGGLRAAAQLSWANGLARLYQRFGQASLFLGDRLQAEEAEAEARRLAHVAGDRELAAEAALHLGQLALGRGDSASARLLGEEALRAGQRLGGVRLRRNALALLLDVATVRHDDALAAHCLAEPPDAPALTGGWRVAVHRWERTWGGREASANASPATLPTGYRGVELLIEEARTYAERGERASEAARVLVQAAALARGGGFRELQLYADVVAGWVTEPTPAAWARTVLDAMQCRWNEVCLAALGADAARKLRRGDIAGGQARLLELRLRAEEQAHAPALALAERIGKFSLLSGTARR